jgi:hypothetical protein
MPDDQGWVIHVASFEMVVFGRLIQRCAVCGCKLVDSGKTEVRVLPGVVPGQVGPRFDPPMEIFEPQTLVAEKGGVFKRVVAPDDFYPERNGCVTMLED